MSQLNVPHTRWRLDMCDLACIAQMHLPSLPLKTSFKNFWLRNIQKFTSWQIQTLSHLLKRWRRSVEALVKMESLWSRTLYVYESSRKWVQYIWLERAEWATPSLGRRKRGKFRTTVRQRLQYLTRSNIHISLLVYWDEMFDDKPLSDKNDLCSFVSWYEKSDSKINWEAERLRIQHDADPRKLGEEG